MAKKRGKKRNRSLKSIVGEETYAIWTAMLKSLVPEGRTHRIAPLVAGMMHYASNIACEKDSHNLEEGSVADSLLMAAEAYEPDELADLLLDVVAQLFADAGVKYKRSPRAPSRERSNEGGAATRADTHPRQVHQKNGATRGIRRTLRPPRREHDLPRFDRRVSRASEDNRGGHAGAGS